jgi:hypothetical protein
VAEHPGIFQRLGIRVYVFHDWVEIKGFIPTEVMDIPHGTDHIKREVIISPIYLN